MKIKWGNRNPIRYVKDDSQSQRCEDIKNNPEKTLRDAQPVWNK